MHSRERISIDMKIVIPSNPEVILAVVEQPQMSSKVDFIGQCCFKDAHEFYRNCEQCQRTRTISRCDTMPRTPVLITKIFDVWGIDFTDPFPPFGIQYIRVAIDYDSKWVEVIVGN